MIREEGHDTRRDSLGAKGQSNEGSRRYTSSVSSVIHVALPKRREENGV